jgi:hypothetical protein
MNDLTPVPGEEEGRIVGFQNAHSIGTTDIKKPAVKTVWGRTRVNVGWYNGCQKAGGQNRYGRPGGNIHLLIPVSKSL